MYGVRIDFQHEIVEKKASMAGTEEGYKFFESEGAANAYARNAQYTFLRWEWNRLKDYDSERAKELEPMLWGHDLHYMPGEHRKKAKKSGI